MKNEKIPQKEVSMYGRCRSVGVRAAIHKNREVIKTDLLYCMVGSLYLNRCSNKGGTRNAEL